MRVRNSLAVVLGLALTATLPVLSQAAEPAASAIACTAYGQTVTDPADCTVTGAAYAVGEKTFEPTMGAAPDGSLYFSTTPGSGVAVGFGAGISRSTDAGRTWKDVSPRVAGQRVPVETNDPYIYVDPGTGRVVEFHMSPILTCATTSVSDDGGASWTTNPLGCGPTGAWDHQTMVAAKPRTLPTVGGYPNVLHQCVNAVYAEMCSRSLDGGLTWSPSTPAYGNSKLATLCGTQTGHLAALPDGTVLLPTSECGDKPYVYVSKDDGLTWTRRTISDIAIPFTDPTIAVDANGTAYAGFVDRNGALFLSVSKDGATTWSPAVRVTPPGVTATMPAITVGDPGRIAIAFPGTDDLPGGFADYAKPAAATPGITWGGWFAVSTDALSATPRFELVEATGTDPLERGRACVSGGRCSAQVDFIEATVTPDGTPFASFADGCIGTCVKSGTANSAGTGMAVAVTASADLCATRCGRFGPATSGVAKDVPVGGPTVIDAPVVSAVQAPVGAAVARARQDDALHRPAGYGLVG